MPPRVSLRRLTHPLSTRTYTISHPRLQQPYQPPNPQPYNFYRTHGRAFFKCITLAFLTFQFCHWAWLVVEAEEEKDVQDAQIRSLEGEVRLLDEGRKSHLPGGGASGEKER